MSLSPSPSRRFHVVSLQVPFPPDYGGVIDIYYKLKALKKWATRHGYTHSNTTGVEPNN